MAYEGVKIRELVDRAVFHSWSIPEFQRGFVWKSTQVRDLLESLWLDYPIGSLLVWNSTAATRIAAAESPVPRLPSRAPFSESRQARPVPTPSAAVPQRVPCGSRFTVGNGYEPRLVVDISFKEGSSVGIRAKEQLSLPISPILRCWRLCKRMSLTTIFPSLFFYLP
jgi:hypothetical protein